ncbi:MAG: hypothetical protein R2864_13070 [Syntrophotaleaceae bacterium]
MPSAARIDRRYPHLRRSPGGGLACRRRLQPLAALPFDDPKNRRGDAVRHAAQLPVPEQECLIVTHARQGEADGGCRGWASAVPETAVAAFLEPLTPKDTMQILDLAPSPCRRP